MKRCSTLASLLAVCLAIGISAIATPTAANDVNLGTSDSADSPPCELLGLVGYPPAGWTNDPMSFSDPGLAGCEMTRASSENEILGFLRLLSIVVPEGTPKEKWLSGPLDLEVAWLEEGGMTFGEPLFRRDNVPISGLGEFENGTGLGIGAMMAGSEGPREVHFLGFNSPTTQYLVTLVTPARDVDEGALYKRNTDDFGVLIRSFQLPDGD